MKSATPRILTINGGPSNIKFALFGLLGYLARTEEMSAKQFSEMVNFQSGLLGISETSSDMRDLLERKAQDVRAAEAVALFCYPVKKWIGSFAARSKADHLRYASEGAVP